MHRRFVNLPRKMKGSDRASAAPVRSFKYAVWSLASGTVSILAILALTNATGYPLLIGSFGASAVLLFGSPDSPLAQPRNLLGGHVISALVAVVIVGLGGGEPWTVALAVGISIALMYLTHTTHPPGGATALIGVQGHAAYGYVLAPVLAGSLILLVVALLANNIVHHRQYPKHWL